MDDGTVIQKKWKRNRVYSTLYLQLCTVEGCGRNQRAKGVCHTHYVRIYRHGTLLLRDEREPLPERLKARAPADPVSGCWNWQGKLNDSGYGMILIKGRECRAHRVSYKVFVSAVDDCEEVCHTCDNPPCINPDHLFVGTHAENMRDMASKGRGFKGPKLSSAAVREIRQTYGECGRRCLPELALKYQVSQTSIRNAAVGFTWRHVD